MLAGAGTFVDEAVLVCAIRNRKFWNEFCRGRLNSKREDSKYDRYEDFVRPVHNLLYSITDQCHEALGDGQQEIPEVILLNVLENYRGDGKITPDEFQAAVASCANYWQLNAEQLLVMAKQLFSTWFEQRRTHQLAQFIQTTRSVVSVGDVLERLRGISRAASGLSKEQRAPTILESLKKAHEDPEVLESYPLPSLGDFAAPLGGGIVPGELGLIITPPNGGKTVLANQMCADLALSKRRVVLVTTEQSANQMYWRQFSNLGNIDFTRLARGYDPKQFTDKENARIATYCERVDPYLRIDDWSQNPGTIETNLEPMFQNYLEDGFQPEVLIFDWLGGGLSQLQADKMRDHMIAVARTLRTICKSFGAGGVLFAQANAEQTKNTPHLDGTHADNCKMLHTFADWGCGISTLTDKERGAAGSGKEQIAKRQCFNFFKTRNATTNYFWYERDFKYQRWRQESGTTFYRDPLARAD